MAEVTWEVTWEEALELAIRYYVYAKLKCRVYKRAEGFWQAEVIGRGLRDAH